MVINIQVMIDNEVCLSLKVKTKFRMTLLRSYKGQLASQYFYAIIQ